MGCPNYREAVMYHRLSIADVTEDQLREANAVFAVDPRRPNYREEVDRLQLAAAGADRVTIPSWPDLLVEIDSRDESQLRRLVKRTARARGLRTAN